METSGHNAEVERLAAEIARLSGETETDAILNALRARLADLHKRRPARARIEELRAIAKHCASLPVLDPRSADEILGYDEHGLPT